MRFIENINEIHRNWSLKSELKIRLVRNIDCITIKEIFYIEYQDNKAYITKTIMMETKVLYYLGKNRC